MVCTLYSFKSCPHYCAAVNPANTSEVLDNFDTFSAESADCLGAERVDRHISSSNSCPKCREEPSDALASIKAVRKEINKLKDLIESVLSVYDILELAHQQFALNDMALTDDPFMADIWHAVRLTREAEDDLFADPDELTAEKLEMIFAELNKARISYSLFCAELFGLKTSVEMLTLLGGSVLKMAQSEGAGDDETVSSRAAMAARIVKKRWNKRVNAAFE
ncbi:hypothetical protein LTR86_004651 [Recurvomyces mirabilis]|nr:hypothetical protein LTR86_004651 [Recurvomyces mirabilis]